MNQKVNQEVYNISYIKMFFKEAETIYVDMATKRRTKKTPIMELKLCKCTYLQFEYRKNIAIEIEDTYI